MASEKEKETVEVRDNKAEEGEGDGNYVKGEGLEVGEEVV